MNTYRVEIVLDSERFEAVEVVINFLVDLQQEIFILKLMIPYQTKLFAKIL